MPTPEKTNERRKGEKPNQRFRFRVSSGFKKFVIITETLALLTSPLPLSFINNDGGNVVMASPALFKIKAMPKKDVKKNAEDAAVALFDLFRTGNKSQLDRINFIFNKESKKKKLKELDLFQAEFRQFIANASFKDPLFGKFLKAYQLVHPEEKWDIRKFMTVVGGLYTAPSHEAAAEEYGEELTNRFIDFATEKLAYTAASIYLESFEDFDKIPENLKKIEAIGKVRLFGSEVKPPADETKPLTQVQLKFIIPYSALFTKKVAEHKIYKEYYHAYFVNEKEKLEKKLEQETGEKVKLSDEKVKISAIELLRAIGYASKIWKEKHAEGKEEEAKKEIKEKYGTLFLFAVGRKYVSTAQSIAAEKKTADELRADIVSRYDSIKKDIKKLKGILKSDMFKVLKPALQGEGENNLIGKWEAENEEAYRASKAYYMDGKMLEGLDEDHQKLMKAIVTESDLKRVMKTAFLIINVAETGDAESNKQLAFVLKEFNTIKTENIEKYGALNASLKNLILSTQDGAELFELINSSGEEAILKKAVEVHALFMEIEKIKKKTEKEYGTELAEAVRSNLGGLEWLEESDEIKRKYFEENRASLPPSIVEALKGKEDTAAYVSLKGAYAAVKKEGKELPELEKKIEVAKLAYGDRFVELAGESTWLRDPEKASHEYMRDVVKKEIPYEVALFLLGSESAEQAAADLRYACLAVALGTEDEIKKAEEKVGKGLVDSVKRNFEYLRWVIGKKGISEQIPAAGEAELEETISARLLFMEQVKNYKGEKTMFLEKAIALSDKLFAFYSSVEELLTPGMYNRDKFQAFIKDYRTDDKKFYGNDYPLKQYFDFKLLWRKFGKELKKAGAKSIADLPEYLYVILAKGGGTVEREHLKDSILDKYIMSDDELVAHYPGYTEEELERVKEMNGLKMDAFVQTMGGMSQLEVALLKYNAHAAMIVYGVSTPETYVALGKGIEVIRENDPFLMSSFLVDVVPGIAKVSEDPQTFEMVMTSFINFFEMRQAKGAQDFRYSAQEMRPYFKKIFKMIGGQLPDIVTEMGIKAMEDELRRGTEPGPYEQPIDPFLYAPTPGFWEQREVKIPGLHGIQAPPLKLKPEPYMPLNPTLHYGPIALDSDAINHFNGLLDSIIPPEQKMFNFGPPMSMQIGAVGKATIINRLAKYFGPMPANYSNYWLSHVADLGGYYSYKEEESVKQKGGLTGVGMHRTPTGGIKEDITYIGETKEGVVSETTKHDLEQTLTGGALPFIGASSLHKIQEDFQFETTEKEGETTQMRTEGTLDTFMRLAEKNKTDMLIFADGLYMQELTGKPIKRIGVTEEDATASIDEAQDAIDEAKGEGKDTSEAEELLTRAQTALEDKDYGEADYLARQIYEEKEVYQEEEIQLRSKLYFITPKGNIYQLAYGKDTEAQLMNYFFGSADTEKVLASLRFWGEEMFKEEGKPAAGFDGAAFGVNIGPYTALGLYNLVANVGTMEPLAVQQALGMAIQNVIKKPVYKKDIIAAFYRGAEKLKVTNEIDEETGAIKGIQSVEYDKSETQTVEVMWRHVPPNPKLDPAWEVRVAGGVPFTVGAKAKATVPKKGGWGATLAYTELDYLKDYRIIAEEADEMAMKTKNMLIELYGWKENEAKDAGFFLGGNYLYSRLVDMSEDPQLVGDLVQLGVEKKQHFFSTLFIAWAQKNNILLGLENVPEMSEISDRINDAMQRIQENPQHANATLKTLQNEIKQSFNRDIWRFSVGWSYNGTVFKPYIVGGADIRMEHKKEEEGLKSTYDLYDIKGNVYALLLFGKPHDGYPGKAYIDFTTHMYGYSPKTYEMDSQGDVKVSAAGGGYNYADFYFGVGSLGWPAFGMAQYQKRIDFENIPKALKNELSKKFPKLTGGQLETVMEKNMEGVLIAAKVMEPPLSEKKLDKMSKEERYDYELERKGYVKKQLARWSVLQSEDLYASDVKHRTLYMRISPETIKEGALRTIMVGTAKDFGKWKEQGLVLGLDLFRIDIKKNGMKILGNKTLSALSSIKAIGGFTIPLRGEEEELLKATDQAWSVGLLAEVFKHQKAHILSGFLYGEKQFAGEKWEGWTFTLGSKFTKELTKKRENSHYAYIFVDSLTKYAKVVTKDELGEEIKDAEKKMKLAERITGGFGYTWVKVNLERGDKLKLHFFLEVGQEQKMNIDNNIIADQTPLAKSFIGRTGFKFEKTAGHGLYNWFISVAAAAGEWPYLPATITQPENMPTWNNIMEEDEKEYWFMISGGIRW